MKKAKIDSWYNETKEQSVAVRLTLDDDIISRIKRGEAGSRKPFCLIASEAGWLNLLDDLLRKFRIEEKGCRQWVGNLRESWLFDSDREGWNRFYSRFCELWVASRYDHRVTNLEAWGNKRGDIELRDGKIIEVKYVGMPPDHQGLDNDSAWVQNPFIGRCYVALRAIEAVQQFEKNDIQVDKRIVFICLHPDFRNDPTWGDDFKKPNRTFWLPDKWPKEDKQFESMLCKLSKKETAKETKKQKEKLCSILKRQPIDWINELSSTPRCALICNDFRCLVYGRARTRSYK